MVKSKLSFLAHLIKVPILKPFLPLVNVNKHTIKELFDHYGVTATLFPITWSCEDPFQADHVNPKHCGRCYFCLEREFVFEQL